MKGMLVRKIKRKIRNFFLNLYLFVDHFIIFPILLLMLPSQIPYRFLRWRGDLRYRFDGKTRAKVSRAMSTRHPARPTGADLDAMVRRFFWIQESFFFDTYYIGDPRVVGWMNRFVEWRGREHLDRSLASGKGAVVATFHFHHPYHAPGFLSFRGYPVTAYAANPSDLNVPLLAKYNAWYGFSGGEKRGDLKMVWAGRKGGALLRQAISRGRIGLALLDAPLPGRKGLSPVTMLGEPMLFPSGLVDIVHETGAPVHTAHIVRDFDDWRRATLTISPPLEMTGDRETDFQTIISSLEAAVVANPGHWWGWAALERATADYHAEYRRKVEEARGEVKR